MAQYRNLSFGKLIKDINGSPVEVEKYAIYHTTHCTRKRVDPKHIKIGVSKEYFKGYLTCFSYLIKSSDEEITIINGISPVTKGDSYPNCEFSPLEKKELEDLVGPYPPGSIPVVNLRELFLKSNIL